MKITVVGSLGNIGKHLTEKLVEKGHQVTGIDNKVERSKVLLGLGALPAIGDLDDLNFLKKSFKGADAIFIMYPPVNYLEQEFDLLGSYKKRANNYSKAISSAGVERVVNLSSMGAHLDRGNGVIKAAFYVEQILNQLPDGISVTHIRPNSLYTNLYGYMDSIKYNETIYASFGSEHIPWTSPIDIADVVVEELTKPTKGKNTRYVASEELTGDQVARIIGKAIGMPELKWKMISYEEMINNFRSAGMGIQMAEDVAEMYAALGSGLMVEDYFKNKPKAMGKVKLKDFAKEFAEEYEKRY